MNTGEATNIGEPTDPSELAEAAARLAEPTEAEPKEAAPQESKPAFEPRLADPATIAMVAEMDAKRTRRPPTREPAPRGAREMMRFKIARP